MSKDSPVNSGWWKVESRKWRQWALWGCILRKPRGGDAISILLFSFLCYNALLRDSRRLIKFCKTGLCYDLEDWGTACGYTLGDCSRQPGEAGWELEWSREGGRRGDTWQLRSCKCIGPRMISVMLGEERRVKDRTSAYDWGQKICSSLGIKWNSDLSRLENLGISELY